MCGITAAIQLRERYGDTNAGPRCSEEELVQQLHESLDRIQHRGPDCRGHWIAEDQRVGE